MSKLYTDAFYKNKPLSSFETRAHPVVKGPRAFTKYGIGNYTHAHTHKQKQNVRTVAPTVMSEEVRSLLIDV